MSGHRYTLRSRSHRSLLSPPAPRPSQAALQCLHSSDLVQLIAAGLRVDELLQASALSRALHALLDSDTVWRGRLTQAQAEQHAPFADPQLACSTQPTALSSLAERVRQGLLPERLVLHPESQPPLPSDSEVAALCLAAFVQAEQQRRQAEPSRWSDSYELRSSRVMAILRLPSSAAYHARVITPKWSVSSAHEAAYIQFELQHTGAADRAGRWEVARMGHECSGWLAINIADNLADEDVRLNAEFSAASGVSCKARYIDLRRCSEHRRTGCGRLVRPSSPLRPVDKGPEVHLPIIAPLPLCSSCLSLMAHAALNGHVNTNTAHYSVTGVTRISRTEFEVSTYRQHNGHGFRVNIQGDRVVTHYGSSSNMYLGEYNVCAKCLSAIGSSRAAHMEICPWRHYEA